MSVTTRSASLVLGLAAAACCTSSLAAGILTLSSTEFTLLPAQAARELEVGNAGDTTLYLTVDQALVTNPGQTPEQRMPVTEVPKPGLLVQPSRLVLAPGQRDRMALKVLETPRESQVWRVTFRPQERIAVDADGTAGAPAPLFVSIGYGVVVYQIGSESGSKSGSR
jgi:hypothetical protein